MSLSAALAGALSGLSAAARGAEVVSANLANARTDPYGRRELALAANARAPGVLVTGVTRHVAAAVIADRRIADAAAAEAEARAAFLSRIEGRFGPPESEGSVGARIAALEAALRAAASRPDSEVRLATVLEAARGVTRALAAVGAEIDAARTEADRQIAREVEGLNAALRRIAALNAAIRARGGAGGETAGLMDQRQSLIDGIAAVVPLRELAREGGQVALYTVGGVALLDARPATFGFVPAGMVTADMTIASGALAGLTLEGTPLAPQAVAGGRLAAAFAIRDELGPAAQARLDALARDLVERCADPAADPTLAPGAAGLFTDLGGPFDPADEVGLAQRLRLNAAADPAQGGALWRLRDGLGAGAPGPVGDGAQLSRLAAALEAARLPASGGFLGGARSAGGLAGEVLSLLSGARLAVQGEASFAAARAETLKAAELGAGVDSDAELERLLALERAYAANARVVRAVDEMLKLLLGI